MDYKEKYESALERAREWYNKTEPDSYTCIVESIFPELKESEDERIRKELITHCRNTRCVTEEAAERIAKWIAWLEKQGNQTIFNTPSRETILSIWELGNDWKELTKGVISTEHGTQLDYIQKHWNESEYYLREKQGEQEPTNKQSKKKSTDNLTQQEAMDIAVVKCFNEQESVNKVEHKFNVGDWIIFAENHNSIYQVERIDNYRYYLRHYLGGTLSLHFDKL